MLIDTRQFSKGFRMGASAVCLLATSYAWCDGSAEAATTTRVYSNLVPGYFLALHGGVAIPGRLTFLLKEGYTAGAEYGYRYDNYRAALQIDFNSNDFKNSSVATYNTIDLLLDLIYDFHYQGPIIPFIGGGAGYVRAWKSQCSSTWADCTYPNYGSYFGYQGIAGIGLQWSHFRFDIRYRYFALASNNNFYQNIGEGVVSYYFN